jgi:hypothetical protein
MAWRFRKSIKFGPLRLNLSKSGIGTSIGVRGFRVGKDAKGRSYTATSIPGTGIYSREYASQGKTASGTTVPGSGAAAQRSSGAGCLVLLLALVAGGLLVYLLTPKAVPPPVTPLAVVSTPQAPPPVIHPRRARKARKHSQKPAAIPTSAPPTSSPD